MKQCFFVASNVQLERIHLQTALQFKNKKKCSLFFDVLNEKEKSKHSIETHNRNWVEWNIRRKRALQWNAWTLVHTHEIERVFSACLLFVRSSNIYWILFRCKNGFEVYAKVFAVVAVWCWRSVLFFIYVDINECMHDHSTHIHSATTTKKDTKKKSKKKISANL